MDTAILTKPKFKKLINLDEETKTSLHLQAVAQGMNLTSYIETILINAAQKEEDITLSALMDEGDMEILTGKEEKEFDAYIKSFSKHERCKNKTV